MSLQERLNRIRNGFESKAPQSVLEVMHQAADDLRHSGILDHMPREGAPAPPFVLQDSRGRKLALYDLLKRGPVILTFFRGHW
ncbi:MAG: hypothetical protein P8018_11155 [Acidobacteriota bacterium]